jgi:hypothetical protein
MTNYTGYDDNFDYGPKVINPKSDSSQSTPKYTPEDNAVTDDSFDQINRGQMGIMDEDNNQGNIGSPIIGSNSAKWYSYYDNLNFYTESSVGDDDNPGYETDPDHSTSNRDTDDVEENADADYGGKHRRDKASDSNLSTLVAMGGIGAIPEGFVNKDENVHYGDDESFSHSQSKKPSETGISGENSPDFDPFDKNWNS